MLSSHTLPRLSDRSQVPVAYTNPVSELQYAITDHVHNNHNSSINSVQAPHTSKSNSNNSSSGSRITTAEAEE
jgi:hypothetical protein